MEGVVLAGGLSGLRLPTIVIGSKQLIRDDCGSVAPVTSRIDEMTRFPVRSRRRNTVKSTASLARVIEGGELTQVRHGQRVTTENVVAGHAAHWYSWTQTAEDVPPSQP